MSGPAPWRSGRLQEAIIPQTSVEKQTADTPSLYWSEDRSGSDNFFKHLLFYIFSVAQAIN